MPETIDESALLTVCYDIARTTSWEYNNQQATSLDSIASKANRYKQIALEHVEWLDQNGIDPNELIGAVKYLGIHAIPPMRDDEGWFSYMLELIVQLFAPNVVLQKDDEVTQFLRRLRNAIDRTIQNAD